MRVDTSYTHPDDMAFFEAAGRIAIIVANRFDLPLKVMEHKRRPSPEGHDGVCYVQEGRISVVFRYRQQKTWWRRRRLTDKYILQTVAHELAHLKGITDRRYINHGEVFKALEKVLIEAVLEEAKKIGLITC